MKIFLPHIRTAFSVNTSMNFNQLYSLLFEARYISTGNQRKTVELPKDEDYSIKGIRNKIIAYTEKYGISDKNYKELIDKLSQEHSSLLFRGHKTFDPFEVAEDTKSPPGTVYWAKDPSNAMYIARPTDKGTKARGYYNLIQKVFSIDQGRDGGSGASWGVGSQVSNVGFLTIARPKNKDVEWYDDFGVENSYNSGKPKDSFIQKPGRIPERGTSNKENQYFHRGETALGRDDIARYTTYLFFEIGKGNYKILSLKKLAQIDRKLYDMLMENKIWDAHSRDEIHSRPQKEVQVDQKYNFNMQKLGSDYGRWEQQRRDNVRRFNLEIEELQDSLKYWHNDDRDRAAKLRTQLIQKQKEYNEYLRKSNREMAQFEKQKHELWKSKQSGQFQNMADDTVNQLTNQYS